MLDRMAQQNHYALLKQAFVDRAHKQLCKCLFKHLVYSSGASRSKNVKNKTTILPHQDNNIIAKVGYKL